MKKSTKGAVAAAAAGVLLLGGAGSLAFWSDSEIIGGGTINAGHISLDDTTLGTDSLVETDDGCVNAPFYLDSDESLPGTVFVPGLGGSHLVPGDELTKVCTFNVNAVGDHLRATVEEAAQPSDTGTLTQASSSAVFTIGGNSITEITEGNNDEELKATITVTFPGLAATNASQDDVLNVGAYTVNLTQVHFVAP